LQTTAAAGTRAAPAVQGDFRHAGPSQLGQALQHSRQDTLATFAHFEAALPASGCAVPYSEQLNPPLWELGHVGWFQAHWLERNPQRLLGVAADPQAARLPARRLLSAAGDEVGADALYDSSTVSHATRWHLPLPNAQATRDELAATLQASLQLLHRGDDSDSALYFHRLCLAHEDMHHEAAVYMAQALGIALPDARFQHQPLPAPAPPLHLPPQPYALGGAPASGFAFDNECGTLQQALAGCSIDSQVLRWRDYLPFVEDGGYTQARWWPGRAAAWRAAPGHTAPRYLQQVDGQWQQWRHGRWQALNPDEPACHLTLHEAEAWCAWAGRRLPTEAEWECAARAHPGTFNWGAVWEWTASSFEPFEGFVAHPYRDYSAPWFGSRRVLRGASVATQPRMRHVRYRNFFTPERNDIFAGFRSCAAL
jgi:ergothioneine biosynthesis protein EgtB